jgi:serine/threonine protein kinase/WD40 repeat protein
MPESSLDSKSIFAQALEITDARQRGAFLRQACEGDAALQSEIEEMLHLHDQAGGFMQNPGAFAPTHLFGSDALAEKPGTLVGHYKLLQQIGEGGMGVVFMAEQEQPVRRKVALKIIKPGMDSRQVIARFEAERQALAMMDHSNIAKVLDAGTTESGRPYFVMELVHGVPITEYCDANRLSNTERLELFVPVCQALQHAHQKGIVHRDVKPSNILVTQYDDKPVPKVIDFGVAKAMEQRLTEKTLFTQYGTLVGTFEYMSPEQAELNAFGVDTRSDVYSLGVLLYELLTGTTPLEKSRLRSAAYGELVRIIKEEEPPRPSVRISMSGTLAKLAAARKTDAAKLSALVKGELDWIVMKCLEKDRTRRYDGANSLAKDVQRYLSNEAVEACPPTLGYRLQKLYRKNRATVWVGSTIAAVLLLATGVSVTFGIRAKRAELLAARSAKDAIAKGEAWQRERNEATGARSALEAEQNSRKWSDYISSIQFAQAAWQQHQLWPTRNFLDRTPPELRGWEWHYLDRLCQPEKVDTLTTAHKHISSAQYSPDGRWIVTVSGARQWADYSDSSVEFWNTATLKMQFTLCGEPGFLLVDISSDGQHVLVTAKNKVTIWDISDLASPTPQPLIEDDPDEQYYYSGCFSPDGKTIVIAKGRYVEDNTKHDSISLWDVTTRQRKKWPPHESETMRTIFEPAFAADGQWVYSMVREGWFGGTFLKIWDVSTGEELLSVEEKFVRAYLSPDGSRLAAILKDHSNMMVWRIRRDGNRPVIDDDPIIIGGHTGLPFPRPFSRDSKYLPTAGDDGTVRIRDVSTMTQIRVLAGAGYSAFVNFSPDGQDVITWGSDSNVRVWAVEVKDPQVVSAAEERVYSSVPSPNGKRWLTFDDTETKVCEIGTFKPLYSSLAKGRGGWSPDGRRIWISSDGNLQNGTNNVVLVYNAETGELVNKLEGARTPPTDYCCNADGSQIVASKNDGSVIVWDTNTDQTWELAKRDGSRNLYRFEASYSPDGRKIFIHLLGKLNSTPTALSILDAETRKPIVELESSALNDLQRATFSKDGRLLLVLFFDVDTARIRIWDTTTGKLLRSFPVDAGWAARMEISPDGSRILVTSDYRLHLIDAQSGDELLVLPINGARAAKFDRDGNKIIVWGVNKSYIYEYDKVLRILDGTPMSEAKQ